MKYKIGDRFRIKPHFQSSGIDWNGNFFFDQNTIFTITQTRFNDTYVYALGFKRYDSGEDDAYSFVPATWIDANFIHLTPDTLRELEGDYYK